MIDTIRAVVDKFKVDDDEVSDGGDQSEKHDIQSSKLGGSSSVVQPVRWQSEKGLWRRMDGGSEPSLELGSCTTWTDVQASSDGVNSDDNSAVCDSPASSCLATSGDGDDPIDLSFRGNTVSLQCVS